MSIYVYYKENAPDFKITIWDKKEDTCVVQEYNNGKKSRKSISKIREYNGRRYVMCCGHRYYLDRFAKIEL